MNTTVTLDKAGRVVIPKPLRDALRLAPGDELVLESEGDRVTLRPVRSASALRKEHGIWVFRSGRKFSAAETGLGTRELAAKARSRGKRILAAKKIHRLHFNRHLRR
jgi:AbrB family looped-hinge helix DNA binding protein